MNQSADSYQVAAGRAEIEIKEKASRFIGRVYPIESRESAEEILAGLRKKEYNATHHCFAWVTRDSFRYSDDGEPNGSAGKPIYDQLSGSGLVNTLVVVTRYYGGTKLGVGGLVRAYGSAAKAALAEAGVRECFDYRVFELQTEMSLYQSLVKLLANFEALTDGSEFSDIVTLTVRVRVSRCEAFQRDFNDLTRGQGKLNELQGQAKQK